MRRVSAFLRRHLPMMLAVLPLLAIVVVWWMFSAPIPQWIRSAQSFDVVAFLKEHYLVAAAILGGCLLILALIWLPKWQAARPDLTTKERFELENDARKTLGEIIGGAAVLIGLVFAWQNLENTQQSTAKNLEIAQETLKNSQAGQIADRFTKAIDQLGAVNEKIGKQLEIRLGGIYALDQIAKVSKEHYWPIMEVLTAYVRVHAPWSPKDTPPQQDHPCPKRDPATTQGQSPPKLATDIQAVLTVLGERDRKYEMVEQRLDLSGTDLRGAQLNKAHLERAILAGAHLEGASLGQAHLERAQLNKAHLECAYLADAHLEGARLGLAHLERALLIGTYLEGARSLRAKQLCTVSSLYEARLDLSLLEQIRQQCPEVLEDPKKRPPRGGAPRPRPPEGGAPQEHDLKSPRPHG
jgi:hypothetical protein